jgi:hypothetical protein
MQTDAPVTNWVHAACSADACKSFAVVGSDYSISGGLIYAHQSTPKPVVNITPSGENNLLLSWILPSIDFALQQAPDLASGQWAAVPIVPILNYSNLQYQVTIPKPQVVMFYRLASQ